MSKRNDEKYAATVDRARQDKDASPGTSFFASSGFLGRLWPCGLQLPFGSGPTPPEWAPGDPTLSSVALPAADAAGSPRLIFA